IVRVLVIIVSLGLWFWTQALLSRRMPTLSADNTSAAICDGLHNLTAAINQRLNDHPRRADVLLISSSLVIDLLGFYLIAASIFGPSIEPFLGLLMLFALRQLCQALCPLPIPTGMIWRSPGFPTVLVTYGTSNDLFFSGHTAIAVFGAATLATALGPAGIALGIIIALFQVSVVLLLRAHYTMDVFAGVMTALYIHRLTIDFAPVVDQWINHAVAMTGH
ncbi:MAG TPA: phosphatase PAP2-related protein, partial [Tepidisphaeraceae bacterium]|nr:phosphatase PAP2-related protein [Tepidisphaeraceae bacterium]